MTRFEPGSFAVESDHSANCTAITAKEKRLKLFGFIVVVVRQVLVVKVENVGFVHSWPSLHHDLAKTSLPQSGDAPISSLSLSLFLSNTLSCILIGPTPSHKPQAIHTSLSLRHFYYQTLTQKFSQQHLLSLSLNYTQSHAFRFDANYIIAPSVFKTTKHTDLDMYGHIDTFF